MMTPIIEKFLNYTEYHNAVEATIDKDPLKYRAAYNKLLGHDKAVRKIFVSIVQKLELLRLDICEFEDKEHVLQVLDSLTSEVKRLQ